MQAVFQAGLLVVLRWLGESKRQYSVTHLDRVQVFLLGNKPTALLKGAKLPYYLNSWARPAKLEILQYSVVNDLSS